MRQEWSNQAASDFLIARFPKYLCLPVVPNETTTAHYAVMSYSCLPTIPQGMHSPEKKLE